MAQRFKRFTGLSWWLRLALCAGGALGCALCSMPPADAYCVYVPNVGAQSISVIDTTTNSLSATIEVDFDSPKGPALTPDARFLYIAYKGGNTVSVIETATNRVAATVTLTAGLGPNPGIAITPNGAFAYVTGRSPGTVTVLDTARALADPSHAIVKAIEISGADVLLAAAISPDGKFAYLSACATPCDLSSSSVFFLAVVDTSANTLRTTVPGVGLGPRMAVLPNGEFIYSPSFFNETVTVIDTAKALSDPSHAISATIPVGLLPAAVAVTPDGRFAYVANCGESCLSGDEPSSVSTVSVIDTATNTLAATITLPPTSGPTGVAITPDGALAYVPEGWSNSVAVIDTAKAVADSAHAVITNIAVAGPRPEGITIASLPMCVDGHPTCVGDCGVDRQVTVDEILTMVNIALGNAQVSACEAGDANHDNQITVDEILTAVNSALSGC